MCVCLYVYVCVFVCLYVFVWGAGGGAAPLLMLKILKITSVLSAAAANYCPVSKKWSSLISFIIATVPHLIVDYKLEKQVSLIAFRQILS